MRTTPFHERLAPLNQTHLWHHWAGYLVADKYQHSVPFEYLATRNSVALFDTSPLFKYRIAGPDATQFLAGVLTRDIRTCDVGQAHYTVWCDDGGYVLEDGVVLRTGDDEYLLTTAEPNLAYLSRLLGDRKVDIIDTSDDYGILAIQGPHAADVLDRLTPAPSALAYFGLVDTDIDRRSVTVSRTGFTGDLGYEVWVRSRDAIAVCDAVLEAGADYQLTPIGMQALAMARLDAGMLLIDVDYDSARHAWTDAFRETPIELGLGWMLGGDDDRAYIGRLAHRRERGQGTSRWKTVGIQVDPAAYERLYNEEGLIAPKEGVYVDHTLSLYDRDFNADAGARYVGYVSSFMFSPLLKRHIGLAKIPLDRAAPGTEVWLELMVAHRPKYVPAQVVKTPFYDPARKTADLGGGST